MPTGVYTRTPRPIRDPITRFWRYVKKSEGDGCWLWTGGLARRGYGGFWVSPKTVPAHRYVYIRTYGPLTAEQMVCHRCDTPACVRPDHLFVGTQRDNIQDAIGKKRFDPLRITRQRKARGEDNGRHRFTDEEVRAIRRDYVPGRAGHATPNSLRGLAAKYRVSKYAIQYVLHVGWRHLSEVVIV